jgi:restriction endonuclease S subunit
MRIFDFCSSRVGHSFRNRLVHVPGGSTKLIQPRNICEDGALMFSSDEPILTDITPRNPIKKNEVLFLNKGRFAAAVFKEPEGECWATSSSVIILTLRNEHVLPEYLSLFINSPRGQRKLERLQEMSSIPFVTRRNLEILSIPIPNIEKQHELIAFHNEIREYRRKVLGKTEILKKLLNTELE